MMAPPFSFKLDASGDFQVLAFRGREATSEIYRFDVDLAATAPPSAGEAIGRTATLSIALNDPAHFHGVVTSWRIGPADRDGRSSVRARIEPRLATLRYASGMRIFHDATVIEVATRVLMDHAVPFSALASRDFPRRAHRIQRAETDLDFLERILADEGIFYWFDHPRAAGAEATLVLADEPSAYRRFAGGPLQHRAASADVSFHDARSIASLTGRSLMTSKALIVRNFEHARPRHDQGDATQAPLASVFAQRVAPRPLVLYEHDHAIETTRRAGAVTRFEAANVRAATARLLAVTPLLSPGVSFDVEQAESSLDGGYVVAGVRHIGKAPEGTGTGGERPYEARVSAVPANVAMRVRRPTTRRAPGLETATVMGPPGEEIHTDTLGRIQVRFHWDLETAGHPPVTAWLRVSQPWAGPGYGTSFTPRVGSEVLVGYIDADADRPVVVGMLHNAEAPPPFSLPVDKTKTGVTTRTSPGGGAGHELSFQDRAGEENITLQSSRRLLIGAVSDGSFQVGGKLTCQVAGSRTVDVGGTSELRVASDRSSAVGGNDKHEIAGSATTHVAGASSAHVGGMQETVVGGEVRTTIAGSRNTVIGIQPGVLANEQLSVQGQYSLGCAGTALIASNEGICFHVGKSRLTLLPDRIRIESPEIECESSSGLRMFNEKDGRTTSLSLGENAHLEADSVAVKSARGGTLLLDEEARINAAFVKLNCGDAKGPSRQVPPDAPDEEATFEVLGGGLPPDVTEVILVVATPSGEIIERPCPVGGRTTFKGRPGQKFTLRAMKLGDREIPHNMPANGGGSHG